MLAKLGEFRLERTINISSAFLSADCVPCIAQPTTIPLKSFGILQKGSITIGASVANSQVGRGQILLVAVASRNDAAVDIDRVQVKLVELITYQAQGQKAVHKKELLVLKNVDVPALNKTRKSLSEIRNRQQFRNSLEATYQEMYRDLLSADNQVALEIPASAQNTYNGRLVQIVHYLKVTFYTKALVENPSTKIPIHIGNRDPSARTSLVAGPIATPVSTSDDHVAIAEPDYDTRMISEPERDEQSQVPMATAILLDVPTADNISPINNSYIPPVTMTHPPPSAPPGDVEGIVDTPSHFMPAMVDSDDDDQQDEAIEIVARQMYVDRALESNGSDFPVRNRHVSTAPILQEATAAPTFSQLLYELNESSNSYAVISSKLQHPVWVAFFAAFSSHQFGAVLSHVRMEDQVRVAGLVATIISRHQETVFTCAHCVAAILNTSEYFRSNMVEILLKLCVDLDTNFRMIQTHLNEWEQVITARAFEDALQQLNDQ